MVHIRSVNEIILSIIDFFRVVQPDLDTTPKSVANDLFVSAPASQLALLYDELANSSDKQSFRLVSGTDLDKLAKNFALKRKQSTPSSGVALLTFSSISAPINVNKNDTVISNNGLAFAVTNGISVTPGAANFYRSVASKFRDQLDTVGISDEFAVEVTVLATSPGLVGNIGKFSLARTNIPGVSHVTNVNSFTGGTDQENDAIFRNRILSSFNGSSVGTALGYLSTVLAVNGIADAAVIGPGDPLMTRDGTVTKINTDGSSTILSEGSGGKVDLQVLGSNLVQNIDSFIYHDKSNNNDPTNEKNNVVLGQIAGDENKTISRKRIDNIANAQLPSQPVEAISSVTGSLSGSNFIPKSIDQFGRVSGNFELIKDVGAFGGSPWGFDTFHWISNKISLFSEDRVKGQFNGQDVLTFSDVLEIPTVQQNISITNENSIVTFDRSIIQLLHTPATNVTRVFNVNTGERYVISNQNFDNTGTFNTTGRIQISGNTLPAPSDTLQVDYNWIVVYDQYSDYDGLKKTENPRPANDSIDWGFSSVIKNELISFSKDTSNNFFLGTSTHPISTVLSANIFTQINGTVFRVSSGHFANRLSIILTNLVTAPSTVDSITFVNTNSELYTTAQNDGTFINTAVVVGVDIRYNIQIILPTDTRASAGDKVTVILDETDIFHSTSLGTSNNTQISIPTSSFVTTASIITLRVNYIANVSDLFSSAITSLPASRSGNGFSLNNNVGFDNFSLANTARREHQIIQKNLSNQFFVELSVSSSEYTLISSQIISVARLTDGAELWVNNPGTITTGTSGNYQLIFSGVNSPAIGDRVLVVYHITDNKRFQPISFATYTIKTRIDSLSFDPIADRFFIPLNEFISQASGLSFTVTEPNANINLFSVTDGYLTEENNFALLSSLSENFVTLPDLVNKKIIISSANNSNNNGSYDILSYDAVSNQISISNIMDKITADQISVVRILDGQEVWNYSGIIDVSNNKLFMPKGINAQINDKVVVNLYQFNNLRKSPTKIISSTQDQVVNVGSLTISGTTLFKVQDITFTATNSGFKLNLSEAVRKYLKLNSAVIVPTNIKIAKISKLERVVTVSAGSDDILTTLNSYDVLDTLINNNIFYVDEMESDPNLLNLEFTLPSTANNIANSPKLGDKLRITFYYTIDGDQENLAYSRNGTLYTNKKFAIVNKIYPSSGFKSSQSTKLIATSFTQPALGSRYKAIYDYLAPKQNERIVITSNFNKIIADATFSVENNRPINADVLVKAAKKILLDLTMNVVIADEFKTSTSNVLQTLRNQLISAMTSKKLGDIVDVPTLVNVAQAVKGISRARVLYFNKNGLVGQVQSVQAQKNEFLVSNNIILNTETR